MTRKNNQKNNLNSNTSRIIFLLAILIISLILSSLASAMEMMVPPNYGNAPAQNSQYYSVIFDEEGEAVVALKVNVNNPNNVTLDKLKIEIPGQTVRILNVVQEYHLLKEECGQWKEVCTDENCSTYTKKCSYYNHYVDYYDTNFYPVDYTTEKLSGSSIFTFSLPKVITQQNTATLIIYYKATGYVKKSLGVHGFDFETIKYNYDSSKVRVSINVQNDLFMQGMTSSVDYKPADFGMIAESSFAKSESLDSKAYSEYSRNIEYDYGFVKEASALDPWESFHVKGKYSASKLLLNKGRIGLTIAIILAVLALLFFGARKAYRALKNAGVSMTSITTGSSHPKTSKAAGKSTLLAQDATLQQQSLVVILITSFVSSILLIFGWYALTFISKNLYTWFGSSSSGTLMLLLLLVFFLYSLFMLFAPPVFVGIRFGLVHGFAAFGATIGFLILNLIILAILYASMSAGGYYY